MTHLNRKLAAEDSENPRNASHSIRGFLYQAMLSLKRWLELEEGERIVFEGLDDIERARFENEHWVLELEQVKDLGRPVSLRSIAVQKTLTGFLKSFHTLYKKKKRLKLVFTTTAYRANQKLDQELPFDVLAAWEELRKKPARAEENRAQIVAMLPGYFRKCVAEASSNSEKAKRIAKTLSWITSVPRGWEEFVDAVEWHLEAPDLHSLEQQIRSRLTKWPLVVGLPNADLFLVPYLLTHVLNASSKKKSGERVRSAKDLQHLIDRAHQGWGAWIASAQAIRLRESLKDCIELGSLLDSGLRKLELGRARKSPASLLNSAYEVVKFREEGRREYLEQLRNWCLAEAEQRVSLIVGPAGSGKTRLLLEWCQRIELDGWQTGFLRDERVSAAIDSERIFRGPWPLFVVIDRIEGKKRQIKPTLKRMVKGEKDGRRPKLRLILLARYLPPWWSALDRNDDLAGLLYNTKPIELSPLVRTAEDLQSALQEAIQAFGKIIGGSWPESTTSPSPSVAPPLDRALYLYMAALARVRGVDIRDAQDLLKWVLDTERDWWENEIHRDSNLNSYEQELLEVWLARAMAGLTLVEALEGDDSMHKLLAVLAPSRIDRATCQKLTGYLSSLILRLYGTSGIFRGLEPDLLGERLVREESAVDQYLLSRVFASTNDPKSRARILALRERYLRQQDQPSIWDRPDALSEPDLEWLPVGQPLATESQ